MTSHLKLLAFSGLILICTSLTFRPTTFSTDKSIPTLENLLFNLQGEPKLLKGTTVINSTTDFECLKSNWKFLNHSFFAYEGANHTETICQSLNEGVLYRLAGGGSLKKEGSKCILKANDTRVAEHSLCANWIAKDYQLSKEKCSVGFTEAVFEDAESHSDYLCEEFKDKEISAHVGYKAAFKKANERCYVESYNPDEVTDRNLCVSLQSITTRSGPAKTEGLCGKGKSLVNLLEIESLDAYCKIIPKPEGSLEFTRLAGGVTIAKYGDECSITHHTLGAKRFFKHVLCADVDRT